MAEKDKNWMEKAFANSKGQLRKKLGAKKGEPIAESKLKKATKSENTKTKRQATLAATARRINKSK